MNFEFGKQWLEEHKELINVLQQIIKDSGRFDDFYHKAAKGTILFREDEQLNTVFILLKGQVQLYKRREEKDAEFPVDILQPGSFIGIIAYATGNKSLTTGRVIADAEFLEIPQKDFESYFNEQPKIRNHLHKLLLANLVERYQHTVSLKLKLEAVNVELKNERNDLKQAYYDLKVAQSRLVHQEKMATLGQLVAGVAHEINNPASALIRSIDQIYNLHGKLFKYLAEFPQRADRYTRMTKDGLESKMTSTSEIRKKMRNLTKNYPELSRSKARRLAQLSDSMLEELKKADVKDAEKLQHLIAFHEFGQKLKNSESASRRIANLVQSLKNYSKQDSSQKEWIDVRDGLHDTLQLVRNRLKFYELSLKLEDVPQLYASASELNQVWTNIILNACDAMGKNGELTIKCYAENEKIIVKISDTGPGIDENMLDKIFEPNVTSKRHDTRFGLGLGLYISKDIIEQHDGTIDASNKKDAGAQFTIELPVTEKKNSS